MPRARTGTLIYRRTTGWNARIWVVLRDESGERDERRWVPLETHDKALAKRKLAKITAMLSTGELAAESATAEAAKPETFESFARTQVEQRRAEVASASDDLGYLERDVFPHLGPMPLKAIKPTSVRMVLEAAIAKGHRRRSVVKVRANMFRVMRRAWEDELIAENPVARVRVPKMLEKDLPREILSDEEMALYIASPRAKRLELKVRASSRAPRAA